MRHRDNSRKFTLKTLRRRRRVLVSKAPKENVLTQLCSMLIRRSADIHSMPDREINTNITFSLSPPQHFHDDENLRHERHQPTESKEKSRRKGERTPKTFNSLLWKTRKKFSPWFRFFKFSFPFRSHRCCSLFRFVLLLLKFIRYRKCKFLQFYNAERKVSAAQPSRRLKICQ